MPVMLRGNKWWVDVRLNGQRYRKACPLNITTKSDALTYEAKYKSELENPITTSVNTSNKVLRELFETVYKTYYQHTKSAHTTKSMMNQINNDYDQTLLSNIDNLFLDNLKTQWRNENLKSATINRRLTLLNKCLSYAQSYGWITTLPKSKLMKESKSRDRFLSKSEEVSLLELSFNNNEFNTLVITLLDSGMRLGEALNLERRDIDFDNNKININMTKTNRNRVVPMTSRLNNTLSKYLSDKGISQGQKIFTMDANRIHYLWEQLRKKMNLNDDPQFVIHMLRHTCASRLAQTGQPLLTISKWLGHNNILTTQRYAHLTTDDLDGCVNSLNNF